MQEKWPVESLTKDEARLRHPDDELKVASIFDRNGERRAAIFILDKDDGSGEQAAIAAYWLGA